MDLSSSSSVSLPQNPSRNFCYSQPQNPPSKPADLHTTLSSLKSLICLSHQTLHSLSILVPPKPHRSPNHVPCPFNHHHLMPPHSLFLHSLRCHYPNLPLQNRLHQYSSDSPFDSNFHSIFLYGDCPGVVCLSSLDSAKRTFTIPTFLSVEFADLVHCGGKEVEGLRKECFLEITPSELVAISGETEAWSDYPSAYSHGVLRALSRGTRMLREYGLMNWVIASSPLYGGVVLDVALRDHIFLLFRLCLKAIVKEARSLDRDQDQMYKGRNMSFKCPVLVQALIWFASQLSILYGEMNAKLFAFNMLKQCILDAAALGLLVFPSEQKVTESATLEEEGSPSQNLVGNGSGISDAQLLETTMNNKLNCTVTGKVILESQVAAAIAALRERALLEEKIKGLRPSRPLTFAEHDYVSQRADEERIRRPNYRSIVEHDGLHQQRFSNQESNKTKTREELLAEERDYKRRRMSYRGKKGKRTTLQVTRDIIEEYMVEIKKAGGIGSFAKEAEDGEMFPSESPSAHNITSRVDNPAKSDYASTRGSQYNNRTQPESDYSSKKYKSSTDAKGYEMPRGSLNECPQNADQRSLGWDKRERENPSRSPERYKSHGQSHVQSSHRRERYDLKVTSSWHDKNKQRYSGMSKYHNNRSPVSKSVNDLSVRKNAQKSEVEHRQRGNTLGNDSSDFLVQIPFEDRYNPTESPDMYEDLCAGTP
ncbi:hypothetical protein I3843_07G073600 [Carya illinoinensis]|nr:hypothetical protein I3843_07G073600 [Carya illinoinensis]